MSKASRRSRVRTEWPRRYESAIRATDPPARTGRARPSTRELVDVRGSACEAGPITWTS